VTPPAPPLVTNELDVLESLVPLQGTRLLEAGCGAARLARELLQRHPDAELTGVEVDDRQHAKNLADPAPRLTFLRAGAEAMPFADAHFDGALMLSNSA
jgi:ubiquinone/menaquinone biosynthesis C-methylase UbiE